MDRVNTQVLKKRAIKGNFILLLSGLSILMVSWKKDGRVNIITPAKTVKRDSTILLAALKSTRIDAIPLANTTPTEITAPEEQLRSRAQLQAYMDSLIINPVAAIGLKRDAKAVNKNNTINVMGGKPANGNKHNMGGNAFTSNTTNIVHKVFPPIMPPDPDL